MGMGVVENKKPKREELRVTNPPKHMYDFVKRLAAAGRRTIPKQMELIIDEYKKILDDKATQQNNHG